LLMSFTIMSDAKKEAQPEPKPAEPPAKSSKLMPVLVGINSLLLVGVLGFMAYSMMHKPVAAAAAEEPASEEGAAAAEEPKGEGHGGEAKKEPEKEKPKEEGHGEKKAEGEGEGEGHKLPGGPGPMVKLADFVIHLRNPEVDRYARMSFDVEVFNDADKERLNANVPRLRDAFISYLSDRTLEELRGSEGLGRAKDQLQQKLRELVPEARVRALYISDFVVQ